MADQYGISMGNVLNFRDRAAQRKIEQEDRDLQKQVREAARARNALLMNLRGQAVGGNQGAADVMAIIDPDEAMKLQEWRKSANEEEVAKMAQVNEIMGKAAASVIQSPNKEETYNYIRSQLPEDMQRTMPDQYDETFVQYWLARARSLQDILANPNKITVGGEDRLYRDGQMIESTTSQAAVNAQNTATTNAAGSGIKSADESLMFRQTVELMGGLFDAAGNIQALDPSKRSKVQEIATRATFIYQNRPGLSRTQAVTMAAEDLGVPIVGAGAQMQAGPGQPAPIGGGQPGAVPAQGRGNNIVNWADLP